MLVKTINDEYDLAREFKDYDRENQFSMTGLSLIFNYYNEMDKDIELDVIGICCTFAEYDLTTDDIFQDYGYLIADDEFNNGEDEEVQALLEELENRTFVLRDDNIIVIESF